MTDKQPEALRLARLIERNWTSELGDEVATELRRLYEADEALREREQHWRAVHAIEVARCDKYQAVMKQALEALEIAQEYIAAEYRQRKEMYEPYQMTRKYASEQADLIAADNAITALREQLEGKQLMSGFLFSIWLATTPEALR